MPYEGDYMNAKQKQIEKITTGSTRLSYTKLSKKSFCKGMVGKGQKDIICEI
jgi:hypothetical protein